jgi:hypothetical protein
MARLKAVETTVPPSSGGTIISKNNLATAISNISIKAEQIAKGGYNEHFGYNYARAPDVIRALNPLMHEYGIIITQSETACEMLTPEVIRCSYDFTIEHVPSGETRTIKSSGMSKVAGKRGFNDRAIQAVATTTRKYMLIGLFNLVVDGVPDVDTQGDSKPKTLTKQQAAGTFKSLGDELYQIKNLGDLQEFGETNAITIATLPDEWQKVLRLRYTEKLHELKGDQPKILTVVPAPKTALQQPKPKGGISQRALDNRAQRIRQAQAQGAYAPPINDENPY